MNKTNQLEGAGAAVITIPGARYFPKGITVASDGTFFVGSLFGGAIL